MISRARYESGETFADFMARPKSNDHLWMAILKRVTIPPAMSARVEALGGRWRLLVLNEDWCGDSVNILPIVARLAESVTNMELRILGRDANPDIMDAHLTNGSRSIPIVILLNDKFRECGWWGPRPFALQRWVMEKGMALDKSERYREIRTFYARDRGATTIEEIVSMLEACCRKHGEARSPVPRSQPSRRIG